MAKLSCMLDYKEEKLLKKKEIREGMRLACQAIPKGDVNFKV